MRSRAIMKVIDVTRTNTMKIEISFNNQTNNLDISDLQLSECSPNRVISPAINGNANKSLSLSEPAEDKISLLLTKFDHLIPMYLVPNSQTQQQLANHARKILKSQFRTDSLNPDTQGLIKGLLSIHIQL